MAIESLAITPGSGANVAVDTAAEGHVQIVKLAISADGDATPITATAANGLLVDVSRVTGNVTVVQATAANLKVDASGVAVPITDNAGSLTVDAPATTPVAVRLSTGSAFIDTIPISGTVTIQDGGNIIDVQGTVAATQSGAWNIGTLTTITNAVPITDNAGSITVDSTGNVLTVSGTVTSNQGTPAVIGNAWPVKQTDGTLTATITNVGADNGLDVNVIGSVGPVTQADKSAFTEGSGLVLPIAGVYNDTIAADPTEDQAAALRLTQKRGLHINLRNVAGAEVGIAAAALRIDPTGATNQPVLDTNSAAQLTALQLIDDYVATIASAVPAKGAAVAGTDGTNARLLKVNSSGNLEVALRDTSGAALSETNPIYTLPSSLNKTPVRQANSFSASQTDIAIWTPTAGKKFLISQIQIYMSAGGLIKVFDNSNAGGNVIVNLTVATAGIHIIPFYPAHPSSTVNNVLRYSTGTGAVGDLTVLGYESD